MKSCKAFTLIELLIVVVIVAIIAAIITGKVSISPVTKQIAPNVWVFESSSYQINAGVSKFSQEHPDLVITNVSSTPTDQFASQQRTTLITKPADRLPAEAYPGSHPASPAP